MKILSCRTKAHPRALRRRSSSAWRHSNVLVTAVPLTTALIPASSRRRWCEHAHEARVSEAAVVALRRVLEHAGASRVRDAVDRRIVAQVLAGSGKIIDDVAEVGGWPEHVSKPAPDDGDGDGMPDDWETKAGLDPGDPSDGPFDPDGDGFTNLEDYLNSLAR